MEYKNDKSECKVWNETMRRFVQECWNENGMLEGERKHWYKNGQLVFCEFYQNGKCEGEYESFLSDGRPLAVRFYRDGKIEGESKIWHNDGSVALHIFYQNHEHKDSNFSIHKRRGLLQIKNKLYRSRFHEKYEVRDFLISDLSETVSNSG